MQKSPTLNDSLIAPAALVVMRHLHAELVHQPHRIGDLARGVALVAMKAPLHRDDLLARERADDESAHVARGRRRPHMGNVGEGNEDGVLYLLGQRAESRPQDDAHLRRAIADPLLQHRARERERLHQFVIRHDDASLHSNPTMVTHDAPRANRVPAHLRNVRNKHAL